MSRSETDDPSDYRYVTYCGKPEENVAIGSTLNKDFVDSAQRETVTFCVTTPHRVFLCRLFPDGAKDKYDYICSSALEFVTIWHRLMEEQGLEH